MKTLFTLLMMSSFVITSIAREHKHDDKQKQESKLTDSDKLQIAVQKICPVMGAKLGSMGEPIKIQIGEQIAYLCCKGCLGKQAKAKHWQTIQNNIARAQGVCPIMGKPVTSDMKSTVVDGQQIFVCCPPCIPKIQADKKTALRKVHANYATFVKKDVQAKRDQLHIMAQSICPVTGKKLGSMGAPIEVQVGDEHAFLCCKGCVDKKLSAEHWATIQTNLAKAQSTCPVMGGKLPEDATSTIVNGRKIFVCCASCIKKINANPETYLGKLDAQIDKNTREKKGPNHADKK